MLRRHVIALYTAICVVGAVVARENAEIHNETIFSSLLPWTNAITSDSILGIPLSTFPISTGNHLETSSLLHQYQFPHEAVIAAIAIFFCRLTVRVSTVGGGSGRARIWQLLWAIALAYMAYTKQISNSFSYSLIVAVELFSYTSLLLLTYSQEKAKSSSFSSFAAGLMAIVVAVALSFLSSYYMLCSYSFWFKLLPSVLPQGVKQLLLYLFPISEMQEAYSLLELFSHPSLLQSHLLQLLFVTFHIQVGMGYLGIEFLRQEQDRRNRLIQMDVVRSETTKEQAGDDDDDVSAVSKNGKKDPKSSAKDDNNNKTTASSEGAASQQARNFQKSAVPFIFMVALPYMFQIIVLGNVNYFAYHCFEHDLHRAVRLNRLFEHDAHLVLLAQGGDANTEQGQQTAPKKAPIPPESYASSMDTVVSTCYDICNRKLFSLPKLMLLPSMMMRQPMLVLQITPLIFGSDVIKARVMTFLTNHIESLQKKVVQVQAQRTQVEAFDVKNAQLLHQSGGRPGMEFARVQWERLTKEIQQMQFMSSLLHRTKQFFRFLQRQFVFSVLIDCALAQLLVTGRILSNEIFVFSRAIEDAVDTVLMKSRAESELARLKTEIDKLQGLADMWGEKKNKDDDAGEEGAPKLCGLANDSTSSKGLILQNLRYSRGSAAVSIDFMELKPGVYALTGANGSGKSTLFRILMSCDTNQMHTTLPPSIVVEHDVCNEGEETCPDPNAGAPKIIMPSSQVSEIGQTFYWPLHAKPIEWIYQTHWKDKELESPTVKTKIERVANLLQELDFRPLGDLVDDSKENATDVSSRMANEGNASQSDPNDQKDEGDSGGSGLRNLLDELVEQKEDWFSDLSGGQKSKVELIRKVFVHDSCPSVLLIDETMALLDPTSKALVMSKPKAFCRDSVVIVIYHTDVMVGGEGDGGSQDQVECVPNTGIHVENRTLNKRALC